MGLVDYSDSDSDEADSHVQPTHSESLKRKRSLDKSQLPPLPASFRDLYATNARISTKDDPSLHGGRQRAVPHIEGNWPTHVYLEWNPNAQESTLLNSLVNHAQQIAYEHQVDQNPKHHVTSLLRSDLSTSLPLHISLSRSLVLKAPQKDRFLDAITRSIIHSNVKPFHVHFTNLRWVPNHERTRYFLVAGTRPGTDELDRLLVATNTAVDSFGLGKLYDRDEFGAYQEQSPGNRKKRARSNLEAIDRTDCFHISLAWALEPPNGHNESLTIHSNANLAHDVKELRIKFDSLKVKSGNMVKSIDLMARTSRDEKGILG